MQLLVPGLVVLLDEPFEMTALVAIAFTVTVTLLGIKLTPNGWWNASQESFDTCYKVRFSMHMVVCMSCHVQSGVSTRVYHDGNHLLGTSFVTTFVLTCTLYMQVFKKIAITFCIFTVCSSRVSQTRLSQ